MAELWLVLQAQTQRVSKVTAAPRGSDSLALHVLPNFSANLQMVAGIWGASEHYNSGPGTTFVQENLGQINKSKLNIMYFTTWMIKF